MLALATLLLAALAGGTSTSSAPADPGPAPAPTSLHLAMARHNCTTAGAGEPWAETPAPRSALVRWRGRLRHVAFDRAWSVFTGEHPGEVVALCRTGT